MRDYKLDKKKNKAKIKILYLRSLYSYIVTRIPIARENTMPSLVKKKPYFWLILVSFCLCYLIFEFFPLLLGNGIFSTLILIKNTVALVNVFFLGYTTYLLSHFFSRSAILI